MEIHIGHHAQDRELPGLVLSEDVGLQDWADAPGWSPGEVHGDSLLRPGQTETELLEVWIRTYPAERIVEAVVEAVTNPRQ
ncbi:hypothetical protein [Nesterenkonia alkaliphila]|uniref:Uncharacterized protein n=1 Tax=Nesterenkonia alkaliphila TaxID=1463631 RepID=A0A7K1UH13_9MICC|nr:hypothetical protein [Nesterenkonia alkaliphila]MVT25729.1 hypothetical protein [Nesterenkonia alkaliphila]GFZ85394.1 hypothetical protein GCM10011359_13160 [Nesterenkonia alkaliphila]